MGFGPAVGREGEESCWLVVEGRESFGSGEHESSSKVEVKNPKTGGQAAGISSDVCGATAPLRSSPRRSETCVHCKHALNGASTVVGSSRRVVILGRVTKFAEKPELELD